VGSLAGKGNQTMQMNAVVTSNYAREYPSLC